MYFASHWLQAPNGHLEVLQPHGTLTSVVVVQVLTCQCANSANMFLNSNFQNCCVAVVSCKWSKLKVATRWVLDRLHVVVCLCLDMYVCMSAHGYACTYAGVLVFPFFGGECQKARHAMP